MQMLLTRVGENTKLIVTGDTRQSDLDKLNGLEDFINKIQSLELDYVEYTNLGEEDVVRHPAVSEILSLYYN